MQAIARIAVSMFLVSSAFAAAYHSSAKLRRDGVLNLYPFPRVGRAHHTWEVPLNDFYLEYKPSEKRQLYAFPRVGRSEPRFEHPNQLLRIEDLFHRHQADKRESEKADTGMWFGPRLGRDENSEEVSFHEANDWVNKDADNGGLWFGPRLGRAYKSKEDTYQSNEHSDPEHIDPEFTERKKRQTKQ